MTAKIYCVGECMVEISGDAASSSGLRLGFGGDTLNTCIGMARLLGPARGPGAVGYMTRMGDDPYSSRMRAAWVAEGVDVAQAEVATGRSSGLYAIETDADGERSFAYWRGEAPVRELFSAGDVAGRLDAIRRAGCVYFSGITLAILPEADRRALIAAAAAARGQGALVAVDPNYRASLWPKPEAARWLLEAYAAASVVLTSPDEEASLFGEDDAFARIHGRGAPLVVAKDGPRGATISDAETAKVAHCEGEAVLAVVDTTGAGDAFNAGFLSARLIDRTAEDSAAVGCAMGARVIQHRGAIMPPEAMADVLSTAASTPS